jgi:hypothetical protein
LEEFVIDSPLIPNMAENFTLSEASDSKNGKLSNYCSAKKIEGKYFLLFSYLKKC